MHVTRFKPLRNDEGELRRCREGLLSLLAHELPASQYHSVTIVFDSETAPKHLPDQLRWQHLNVVFARDENSADDYIAKQIQDHHHPKRLCVVSSDHRVQNAASRRKAIYLDSDDWFDAVLEYAPPANALPTNQDRRPDDIEMDKDQLQEFISDMKRPKKGNSKGSGPLPSSKLDNAPPDELFENPFPEGYFDDLEE